MGALQRKALLIGIDSAVLPDLGQALPRDAEGAVINQALDLSD